MYLGLFTNNSFKKFAFYTPKLRVMKVLKMTAFFIESETNENTLKGINNPFSVEIRPLIFMIMAFTQLKSAHLTTQQPRPIRLFTVCTMYISFYCFVHFSRCFILVFFFNAKAFKLPNETPSHKHKLNRNLSFMIFIQTTYSVTDSAVLSPLLFATSWTEFSFFKLIGPHLR